MQPVILLVLSVTLNVHDIFKSQDKRISIMRDNKQIDKD